MTVDLLAVGDCGDKVTQRSRERRAFNDDYDQGPDFFTDTPADRRVVLAHFCDWWSNSGVDTCCPQQGHRPPSQSVRRVLSFRSQSTPRVLGRNHRLGRAQPGTATSPAGNPNHTRTRRLNDLVTGLSGGRIRRDRKRWNATGL